jgi:hypothetical protein
VQHCKSKSWSFDISSMRHEQIAEASGRRQDRSTAVCWPYRFSPKALNAPKIFKPETVLRWHREGFGGPNPDAR